jgi:glucose/arabinose dehydrogenase
MKRAARIVLLLSVVALFIMVLVIIALQAPIRPANKIDVDSAFPLEQIQLPVGFSIEVYAANVSGARSMTQSDKYLFVGTREDKVYRINKQTRTVEVIASNLHEPNGVAFRNGSLYVAQIDRVTRYDNADGKITDPVIIYDKFPKDTHHGWKFIRFGPDNRLYVPVGAPCNLCDNGDPYASITRMNPDGTDFEIYARGIRNTVGFDWDAEGNLWFTDNGRDLMGDDIPPDELNYAPTQGMHFGYPYCHGNNIADSKFTERNCTEFKQVSQALGPHVAALGMRFYNGTLFPEKYQEGIFIAEHGSWNRRTPIGYRVMFVSIENNKPVSYEVFAQGWLQGSDAWGRPVDIEIMSDGSILVSDDRAGAIYRVDTD